MLDGATKRACHLLVLSPRARSGDQAREYRPFGGRPLLAILGDVAAGVSQIGSRVYDEHTLFGGFLFGRISIEEPVIRELRSVPASLIDCELFRSGETAAVETARLALRHVASGAPEGRGRIVLACNDGCHADGGVALRRATSEDMLFANLWIDLCGNAFDRVGQAMARLWGD